MNQHFVREADRELEITTLAERPDGRHRAHAGHRDGDARRLGRRRLAPRAARHEHGLSHLIEHMAFKGTRAPLRARRSPRTSRTSAARSTPRPASNPRATRRACSARTSDVALDVLGDILTELGLRRERARAREGRHPAGIRRRRGHARRPRLRRLHGDGLRRPADRPPDPRHARDHQELRRRHDPGLPGARIRA